MRAVARGVCVGVKGRGGGGEEWNGMEWNSAMV